MKKFFCLILLMCSGVFAAYETWCYEIHLDESTFVKVVDASYLHKVRDTLDIVEQHDGQYYHFVKTRARLGNVIYVASVNTLRDVDNNRDDAWVRRVEISRYCLPMLSKCRSINSLEKRNQFILTLLTNTYKYAYGVNTTSQHVIEKFFRNSQEWFDHLVWSYRMGHVTYDSKKYASEGPYAKSYSHLNHFAMLYWTQIQQLLALLKEKPNEQITVVDLGTGGGNFILCAAKYLSDSEKQRVKFIGVDRGHNDLYIARKMWDELHGADIQLIYDDVTFDKFAARLAKYNPTLIVSNHLLEHLPRGIEAYITDWIEASSPEGVVAVAVPLHEDLEGTVSDHEHSIEVEDIEAMAQRLLNRFSTKLELVDFEKNKYLGMLIVKLK